MVGVFARGNRAEINLTEAGATRLDGDRRQKLHIILKFLDLKLAKLFGAEGLDRHRHALERFLALLRGHDDFVAGCLGGFLRHCGNRHERRCGEKRGHRGAARTGEGHKNSPDF